MSRVLAAPTRAQPNRRSGTHTLTTRGVATKALRPVARTPAPPPPSARSAPSPASPPAPAKPAPVLAPATTTPRPDVPVEHFWFVWRLNGNRPRRRQPSREVALAEAGRLRAENPGAVFQVYEAQLVEEAAP